VPNHVTNIIKIEGNPARIKAMFEAVKNDEYGLGSIDFNKLIPMPPELDIEEGSHTDRGLKAYPEPFPVPFPSLQCSLSAFPVCPARRGSVCGGTSIPVGRQAGSEAPAEQAGIEAVADPI